MLFPLFNKYIYLWTYWMLCRIWGSHSDNWMLLSSGIWHLLVDMWTDVPPKCRFTYRLHGIISQKMANYSFLTCIFWFLTLLVLISSLCAKLIIWVYTFRAIRGFCEHLKNSNNTQMIVSLLPSIMDNLLGMATQYSSEVLSLVMETLALVLSVRYLRIYNVLYLVYWYTELLM